MGRTHPTPSRNDGDTPDQDTQQARNKSLLKIQKIVFTACEDTKVMLLGIYDGINRRKHCGTTSKTSTFTQTLHNLEKIKKVLYKEVRSLEKVVFLMTHKDSLVDDHNDHQQTAVGTTKEEKRHP